MSPPVQGSRTRGRQSTTNLETSSVHSTASSYLPEQIRDPDTEVDEDEAAKQDIEELWFPGCHADLGGGWGLSDGEESPLSHVPLVWMVREAQRAGLEFDSESMLALRCCDETYNNEVEAPRGFTRPDIQITSSPSEGNIFTSPKHERAEPGWMSGCQPSEPQESIFHQKLTKAATKGVLHDCLEFNNGLAHGAVISWKIMEYMPFRRMDLRPDGSWKAITFPLP